MYTRVHIDLNMDFLHPSTFSYAIGITPNVLKKQTTQTNHLKRNGKTQMKMENLTCKFSPNVCNQSEQFVTDAYGLVWFNEIAVDILII